MFKKMGGGYQRSLRMGKGSNGPKMEELMSMSAALDWIFVCKTVSTEYCLRTI